MLLGRDHCASWRFMLGSLPLRRRFRPPQRATEYRAHELNIQNRSLTAKLAALQIDDSESACSAAALLTECVGERRAAHFNLRHDSQLILPLVWLLSSLMRARGRVRLRHSRLQVTGLRVTLCVCVRVCYSVCNIHSFISFSEQTSARKSSRPFA